MVVNEVISVSSLANNEAGKDEQARYRGNRRVHEENNVVKNELCCDFRVTELRRVFQRVDGPIRPFAFFGRQVGTNTFSHQGQRQRIDSKQIKALKYKCRNENDL
jgi:hypothetical protein